MKLIVNADDFGYDDNSNLAIQKCFSMGVISQTTLMVNMPGCEDAITLAIRGGFDDRVGLHINLSEGVPLSNEMKQSRFFCDKDGVFNGRIRDSKLWRFVLPRGECVRIACEIKAQMHAYRAMGLPLNHFDSHGHVCTFPSILPVAIECAKEYGFRSTRVYINMSANHFGRKMSLARKVFCQRIIRYINSANLVHTNFLGYAWDLAAQKNLLSMGCAIEVLCHPNFRKLDLSRDIDGELMDWKRPIEESLGWLRNIDKVTFGMI